MALSDGKFRPLRQNRRNSLYFPSLAFQETSSLVTASSSGESRANCAAVPAQIVIPDIHEFSAAKSVRSRNPTYASPVTKFTMTEPLANRAPGEVSWPLSCADPRDLTQREIPSDIETNDSRRKVARRLVNRQYFARTPVRRRITGGDHTRAAPEPQRSAHGVARKPIASVAGIECNSIN
jgi:hypothetical protein